MELWEVGTTRVRRQAVATSSSPSIQQRYVRVPWGFPLNFMSIRLDAGAPSARGRCMFHVPPSIRCKRASEEVLPFQSSLEPAAREPVVSKTKKDKKQCSSAPTIPRDLVPLFVKRTPDCLPASLLSLHTRMRTRETRTRAGKQIPSADTWGASSLALKADDSKSRKSKAAMTDFSTVGALALSAGRPTRTVPVSTLFSPEFVHPLTSNLRINTTQYGYPTHFQTLSRVTFWELIFTCW